MRGEQRALVVAQGAAREALFVCCTDEHPCGGRENAARAGRGQGQWNGLRADARAPADGTGGAERLAGILKAIADPTRLQLLRLIQSAPNGEACVCELTASLGLRQPTISHHLKLMTAAGLLTRERRAAWAWYAVNQKGLETVQDILRAPAAVRD